MAETSDGEKLHRTDALHTGRGAFIVVVIALLLCPISAAVGYYLNHLLQRPDLQIAQVDQVFVVESHVFNDSVFKALDRDEDAVASIRDNLERLAAPAVCIEWLDGGGWSDECLSTMQQITNGLIGGRKASIKTVLNNIKTLDDWEAPAPLYLQPTGQMSAERLQNEALRNKQAALDSMRGSLLPAAAQLRVLEQIAAELKRMRTATDTPRSGEVILVIGIFNDGNVDGVVANRAKLTFAGKELPLAAGDYALVRAHTYEKMTFEVAEDAQDSADLKAWMELIKSKQAGEIEITLNGLGVKPITKRVKLLTK